MLFITKTSFLNRLMRSRSEIKLGDLIDIQDILMVKIRTMNYHLIL